MDDEILLMDSWILIGDFLEGRGRKFGTLISINRNVKLLYHRYGLGSRHMDTLP